MEQHIVRIKSIGKITHDVLKIVTEKPYGYNFTPGQATEIAINESGWKEKKRPVTFTCLPESNLLEFAIKTYPSRKSVTNRLLTLKKDDELMVHEVFGTIKYKGEGVFIAGGAGITPFISILRCLKAKNALGNNRLIYANRTKADIICESELRDLLGVNFINILSDEKTDNYAQGQITEAFIREHTSFADKLFYVCGPPAMTNAVVKHLSDMHVGGQSIIQEVL